jgi:transcription elongation GreA/GreB family factor
MRQGGIMSRAKQIAERLNFLAEEHRIASAELRSRRRSLDDCSVEDLLRAVEGPTDRVPFLERRIEDIGAEIRALRVEQARLPHDLRNDGE